jgi:hypothetical protein
MKAVDMRDPVEVAFDHAMRMAGFTPMRPGVAPLPPRSDADQARPHRSNGKAKRNGKPR